MIKSNGINFQELGQILVSMGVLKPETIDILVEEFNKSSEPLDQFLLSKSIPQDQLDIATVKYKRQHNESIENDLLLRVIDLSTQTKQKLVSSIDNLSSTLARASNKY
jgi:hypothetical protein